MAFVIKFYSQNPHLNPDVQIQSTWKFTFLSRTKVPGTLKSQPKFCVTFWLPVLRSPSGLGLAAGSCPRRPHVCTGTEHHQVQDLSCTTRSLVTPAQSFPQVLGHTLQSNLEISQGPTTVSLYQTAHSLEAARLHGQLTVQPTWQPPHPTDGCLRQMNSSPSCFGCSADSHHRKSDLFYLWNRLRTPSPASSTCLTSACLTWTELLHFCAARDCSAFQRTRACRINFVLIWVSWVGDKVTALVMVASEEIMTCQQGNFFLI